MIYHDIGLRFDSPTINLFMKPDDFILFCNKLEEVISKEYIMECYTEEDYNYPVAKMIFEDETFLLIHFMHYSDYKSANMIWDKRVERIDLDRLFIIMTDNECDIEHVHQFGSIKYRNKVFITSNKLWKNMENVVYIKKYNGRKINRLLTSFEGVCGKRYIDEFDYIKWMNNAQNDMVD